ncbi:MAG: aminomethyltransferase family protein [Desulfopila sp.]|jgi:aminomethyltransferase|nr:aminomethyltransferase family protein [Desulfopila sp.]
MKKTPLYQWHIDNGAKMAEFAGYSMPLWYPQGARTEHISVIEHAGLFDTSHMAVLLIQGDGAHQLLQLAFSKDLDRCLGLKKTPLVQGRSVYGVFLNERGHVIDDAIVTRQAESLYTVVVNAGMGGTISDHLRQLPTVAPVEVVDLSDKLGKIDIQGPASADILGRLLQDPAGVYTGFPYFSSKGWFDLSQPKSVLLADGTPILLSRTGYTGEFGFEIFLEPRHLEKVWGALLEEGGDRICPCGLASRDSLRAGAMLPLSHQDIGGWPFKANPWQFALPVDERGVFTKRFIGAEALLHTEKVQFTFPFAGFDPRKIVPGENTAVLDGEGRKVGSILTCATDMAIGRAGERIVSLATAVTDGRPEDFKAKGLCCGFVMVSEKFSPGAQLFLTDGKRKIPIEIREEIRPDRTARRTMREMFHN